MSENGHVGQETEKENLGFLPAFHNVWWFFSVVGAIIALLVWTGFLLLVDVGEHIFGVKNQPINKGLFWQRVFACLMEFHGFTEERAWKATTDKRKEIELSVATKPQLIYRCQPFDVANDIAGFDLRLSLADYKERYVRKILGK